MTRPNRSFFVPRTLLLAAATALALSACKPASDSTDTAAQSQAPADAATAPATPAAPAAAMESPVVLTELNSQQLGAALTASGMCSLDSLDGQNFVSGQTVSLPDPSMARFRGWVADKGTMMRPASPALRVEAADGLRAWEIGVGKSVNRGDVARHFKVDALKASGFDLTADLSTLPPGEYALTLVHEARGKRMACDKGRRIRIGG